MKKIVLFADENCMTSRVYLRTFLDVQRDVQAVIVLKRRGTKFPHMYKRFFLKIRTEIKFVLDSLYCRSFRHFLRLPNEPSTLEELISKGNILRHDFFYSNINDFENHELAQTYKDSTFLYTNGGILNESILKKLNFIHIHPGCVPQVRGSDGLLWSVVKLGFPTCSLIEMSKKIDAGRVLLRCSLKDVYLPKYLPLLFRISPRLSYTSLLSTLDPELRGLVLSEFLDSEKVFGEGVWDSTPQEENLQETFFWMHPKVRLSVLEGWVKAANNHGIRKLLPRTNEELVSVTFR